MYNALGQSMERAVDALRFGKSGFFRDFRKGGNLTAEREFVGFLKAELPESLHLEFESDDRLDFLHDGGFVIGSVVGNVASARGENLENALRCGEE